MLFLSKVMLFLFLSFWPVTTFSLLEHFEISLCLVHSAFTLLPSIWIPFHSFLLSFKWEISVLQCWCVNSLSMCVLSHFSCIWLFVIPWAVAHQVPLSLEFSRQEYWSGLPCPPLHEIFLTQGSNPGLPHCREIPFEPQFTLYWRAWKVVMKSRWVNL